MNHHSVSHYKGADSFWKVENISVCDSTNSELVTRLRHNHASPGTVLVALEQTHGKGRLYRQWFSPLGNVALSLALPIFPGTENLLFQYNLVAALAIRSSLSKISSLPFKIKWPNDLWLHGKKICGILGETVTEIQSVVVGIGVNLNSRVENFPENLRPTLTTLHEETGKETPAEIFIETLLGVLSDYLDLYKTGGLASIKDEFNSHLLWRHEKITITNEEGTSLSGENLGLDESGFLLIQDDKDQIRRLVAGDTSLRK